MFFDIKNHLLPGTEPFCCCAQDEEMALVMAFRAQNQGCRFILATPPDTAFLQGLDGPAIFDNVDDRFLSLSKKLRKHLPDMGLGLGCEISCTREKLERILHHLDQGNLPGLNGTRYILVSFPTDVSRKDLWFCLDRLDRAGWLPILSHAQSIHTLKNDIHEIRCLKGEVYRGEDYRFRCLIQMDTLALHFSEQDYHWARKMIEAGVVDMLATGARNTFTHPPLIQNVLEELPCSQEYLEAITWKNAADLLLDDQHRKERFGWM